MNTQNGYGNGNLQSDVYHGDDGKSPGEIESEIEQTRAEMNHTLDEIQRKLSPGQLVDEALSYVRGSGAGGFAANFGATVRDNPVPVTLLGVGLAWLMMSGRTAGRAGMTGNAPDDPYAIMSHDYGNPGAGERIGQAMSNVGSAASNAGQKIADTASSVTNRVSGTAHSVTDRVSSTAQSISERVSDMAGSARERASRVSDRAREFSGKARDVSGKARDQYYRAKGGVQDLAEEQPLVLAALGVALGAAIAACLPATRREDELMGETRDEFIDAGKEQFDSAKQSLKEAAQRTRDDLKSQPSDGAPSDQPRKENQHMAT